MAQGSASFGPQLMITFEDFAHLNVMNKSLLLGEGFR